MLQFAKIVCLLMLGLALPNHGMEVLKLANTMQINAHPPLVAKPTEDALVAINGLTTTLQVAHQEFLSKVEEAAQKFNGLSAEERREYKKNINAIFGERGDNLVYPSEALKWATSHYQLLTRRLDDCIQKPTATPKKLSPSTYDKIVAYWKQKKRT